MKRLALPILTLVTAACFAACGAPAGNNGAAANNAAANAAKPAAAAPTLDALFALDKQAAEAYLRSDGEFFERVLSDKFVMGDAGKRLNKAGTVKMIGEEKCVGQALELTEPQMARIDADTALLTYKATVDATCTRPDGMSTKVPSPVRAATVWIRTGDNWQAVFHGENVLVDPKSPPPPATPEAKREQPKIDDKATPDANTDALVKIELALWEAWKDHDVKEIDELTATDLSFVNIFGTYFGTKAEALKDWTSGNCEVKSVGVIDGVATALSPTVEMLTRTGTADGTCGGQKFGSVIWGVSIYVKDGDAWKFAFGMNSPT